MELHIPTASFLLCNPTMKQPFQKLPAEENEFVN